MTARKPLPSGWWIIPAAILSGAAWFGAAWLMLSLLDAAQKWGAM